eukprot:460206_1
MASLLAEKEQTLMKQWNNVCQTKSHQNIISFFNLHKQAILSSDSPLFLKYLMVNDDIKSMRYVLQNSNPQKYINSSVEYSECPMWWACYNSTFEMVRLIVSVGAIFPSYVGSGLFGAIFTNHKMSGDDKYSCVQYLLNNLSASDAPLHLSNIVFTLCHNNNLPFDRIKMAKLILSKRPKMKQNLGSNSVWNAVGQQHFEFAEYMIGFGAPLEPHLFARSGFNEKPNDIIMKWLLKHNIDINGYMNDYKKWTPLFDCCMNKKYDTIELLLNNGADINKKCVFKNQEITPLEYCKQTFPTKYFEYFSRYIKKKSNVAIDFSNIPNTAFDNALKWSAEDEKLLNETNSKYLDEQRAIDALENELKAKYKKLKELFIKKTEISERKKTVLKWKEAKGSWDIFLNEWVKWDILSFIEFLKRVKYVQKSFSEYYPSDSICKQNIESLVANNLNTFEEQKSNTNTTCFKGIYLLKFNKLMINNMGITSNNDIDCVYGSIQSLIKNQEIVGIEEQGNDNNNIADMSEEGKLIDWLTNIVKLPQYIELFLVNHIDMLVMQDITRDVLKEMGVESIGHQMKILKCAKDINNACDEQYEGLRSATEYI